MSWFNLYRKSRVIIDNDGNKKLEFYDDQSLVKESEEFLRFCEKNKGRNVVVYDDLTFEDLSDREINLLDKIRHEEFIPELYLPPKRIKKSEVRKQVSSKVTLELYRKYNSKCKYCGDSKALQKHHINGDRSNSELSNLELVCFDCHLKLEGKNKFSERIRDE